MTTMTQELTQGSLQIRPKIPSSGQDPKAWKNLVGNKPVEARFSLLPETKPRMGALGTSLIVQIILVAFVVTLPLLFPQRMIPRAMFMVTAIPGPPLEIPAPPKPKPPAPPKMAKVQPPPVVKPAPPKPDVAKFFAPRIEAPKPKPRQVEADLPKVNDTFQPVNLKVDNAQPVRPRDPVKTGLMSSGSSAVPTIDKPVAVEKVQTGGVGGPLRVLATAMVPAALMGSAESSPAQDSATASLLPRWPTNTQEQFRQLDSQIHTIMARICQRKKLTTHQPSGR